jgi:hypothetical protein
VLLSAFSSSALLALTVPVSWVQSVPAFVEYHRVPLLLTPVTAMPVRAPASGSVTLYSVPPVLTSADTRVEPAVEPMVGASVFSVAPVRVGLAVAFSTGASLTGVIVISTLADRPPEHHVGRPTVGYVRVARVRAKRHIRMPPTPAIRMAAE